MDWPQSGEQIFGGNDRRAVCGTPHDHTPTHGSAGDLVVAEASLDYGGPIYQAVMIFELNEGKIARETAYWSEPFEAPGWRAQWVKLADA